METATDEPVQIIGRTEIIIEIGHCVMVFPVFVAEVVGEVVFSLALWRCSRLREETSSVQSGKQ